MEPRETVERDHLRNSAAVNHLSAVYKGNYRKNNVGCKCPMLTLTALTSAHVNGQYVVRPKLAAM